jgi:hypothetical protein
VRLVEEKLKAGPAWTDRDLVFSSTVGGHLHTSRILFAQFKKLLKEAGLPDIRFHDVRRFGDCKIALKGQRVRAITF